MYHHIRQSIFFGLILCLSCTQASYLATHAPWELIFQKKVYGGAAELVGTELNAPSFSLYANGRAIYYRYVDGKRKMAVSDLSREEFLELLTAISDKLTPTDTTVILDESSEAPVTEYYFYGRRIRIKGLGLSSSHNAFEKFNDSIDRIHFEKSRNYIPEKIILYVKRLPTGDIGNWPEWKIPDIDLDKIYKKEISFYEPNSNENSLVIEGKWVKPVQDFAEQTGVYKKCVLHKKIYAVGYRPVLPGQSIE